MSHLVGEGLTALDISSILLGLGSLLVAVILEKNYQKTKLHDFRIFAIVFVLVPLNMFFFVPRHHLEPNVPLFVINIFVYSGIYLAFFFHITLVKWDKIPKNITLFVLIWHFLVLVRYFFTTIQDLPSKGSVLGINLQINYRDEGLQGPLFQIGDTIIVAEGYPFLVNVTRIAIILFGLITYVNMELDLPRNNDVLRARKFWITALILFIPDSLFKLLNITIGTKIPQIIGMFSYVTAIGIVIYIAIRLPYSIVITKEQISRAMTLYELINQNTSEKITLFKINSYIKEIPEELLGG